MAELEKSILGNARIKTDALIPFGFVAENGSFVLRRPIMGGDFLLVLTVDPSGEMDSQVIDQTTGDPYVLYKLPSAHGEYVGAIRDEIKVIVREVKQQCYIQGEHTSELFFFLRDYCRDTYGEEIEYLWHDENGIIRRKDNQKWYLVLMRVSLRKLGIDEDRVDSIVAVRGDPNDIDQRVIFQGYHLNHKSWISLVLDPRTPQEELIRRIEVSRELALGKKKR